MTQKDRRRTQGTHIPERRHSARHRMRAPGVILALVALAIILYQVWSLIRAD